MARPIWKGSISFGLVNIPVTLFSVEKKNEIQFRLLDSRDNARIRYERVNEVTGEEVPWENVSRAYEYEKGEYVVVTDEDFKNAAVEATQTIEIEDFVDADAIDPMYLDKPYLVTPGKKGDKGYVLLRETLEATNKAGIAKVVLRTREYLAALIPVDSALVLNILRFQHELRNLSEFELPKGTLKDYKITPKELEMAEQLVESMSGDWEPEKYKDAYRDALLEWIEKKARADGEITPPAPPKEEAPAGEIVDFMSLLRKSLEKKASKEASRAAQRSKKQRPEPAAKTKTRARAKPAAKTKTKPKSSRKRKAS